MPKRLLITGGKGQLGAELIRCLECGGAEIGPLSQHYRDAVYDAPDRGELDISNEIAVNSWFSVHEYDIVINCAAVTDVDGCERDEKAAYRVNALGPRYLARACAQQQCVFVQISTDYVFSGNESGGRVETDPVNPVSAYGRTKLAGERFAIEENPRTFIIRTAWLYGLHGRNFVKTMLELGRVNESISVVADQCGNPTSAIDLAYEVLEIALTDEYGIFHVAGIGSCSWADFADAIMRECHLPCKVLPITSEQYKERNPRSAKRPKNSSLKNSRLELTIGNKMRPWQESLRSFLGQLSDSER